jgi:hypothetical protein
MVGFDVLKKKNDLAFKQRKNQYIKSGPYTTLKGQYSQLKSFIKKG